MASSPTRSESKAAVFVHGNCRELGDCEPET